MKKGELSTSELAGVVGAGSRESVDDRRINIGDSPNVTVDVEPI
jgi:hypothetical protein